MSQKKRRDTIKSPSSPIDHEKEEQWEIVRLHLVLDIAAFPHRTFKINQFYLQYRHYKQLNEYFKNRKVHFRCHYLSNLKNREHEKFANLVQTVRESNIQEEFKEFLDTMDFAKKTFFSPKRAKREAEVEMEDFSTPEEKTSPAKTRSSTSGLKMPPAATKPAGQAEEEDPERNYWELFEHMTIEELKKACELFSDFVSHHNVVTYHFMCVCVL